MHAWSSVNEGSVRVINALLPYLCLLTCCTCLAQATTAPAKLSWSYIASPAASEAEVLAFVKSQNIFRVNLSDLAWRCKESKAFFVALLAALRARGVTFVARIWAYALMHPDADARALGEYLAMQPTAQQRAGPVLRSALLSRDGFEPHAANTHQFLEYWPLINARAHPLSVAGASDSAATKRAEIQNIQFRAQYRSFLQTLLFRASHISRASVPELASVTYYLLLQDRVDEALAVYAQLNKNRAAGAGKGKGEEHKGAEPAAASASQLALQLDYLDAYVEFFSASGPSDKALAIANKYKVREIGAWGEGLCQLCPELLP